MKINPEIFLKAAELQFDYFLNQLNLSNRYSCLNIKQTIRRELSFNPVFSIPGYYRLCDEQSDIYIDLYSSYFKPNNVSKYECWWDDDNPKANNEARILALLLMYEIAKDLNKKEKKKKS